MGLKLIFCFKKIEKLSSARVDSNQGFDLILMRGQNFPEQPSNLYDSN